MAKNYKLKGGQYEHPNEFKLIPTVRGTVSLQPEFGNVIVQGDIIEAETHNIIQQNGVLTSKVTVTTEGADTVLVPTNIIAELDLADELKLMLLFETPVTLPANTFIKIKETNVPVSNIGGYSISNNTPVFFVLFDNTFFPHKVESGGGTGATETIKGISQIATQTEVNAGVDDMKIVTSKKLKTLFGGSNVNLAPNGYYKLPNGLIFQWGIVQDSVPTNYFPIAFPAKCASLQITNGSSGVGASVVVGLSNTAFTVDSVEPSAGKSLKYWFAVGY